MKGVWSWHLWPPSLLLTPSLSTHSHLFLHQFSHLISESLLHLLCLVFSSPPPSLFFLPSPGLHSSPPSSSSSPHPLTHFHSWLSVGTLSPLQLYALLHRLLSFLPSASSFHHFPQINFSFSFPRFPALCSLCLPSLHLQSFPTVVSPFHIPYSIFHTGKTAIRMGNIY